MSIMTVGLRVSVIGSSSSLVTDKIGVLTIYEAEASKVVMD